MAISSVNKKVAIEAHLETSTVLVAYYSINHFCPKILVMQNSLNKLNYS